MSKTRNFHSKEFKHKAVELSAPFLPIRPDTYSLITIEKLPGIYFAYSQVCSRSFDRPL